MTFTSKNYAGLDITFAIHTFLSGNIELGNWNLKNRTIPYEDTNAFAYRTARIGDAHRLIAAATVSGSTCGPAAAGEEAG